GGSRSPGYVVIGMTRLTDLASHKSMENGGTVTGAPDDDAFIELKGVSLSYGSADNTVQALNGVDLSLAKGEFIAVVGPSGCGKSSLMRLVTGLTPPSSGTIKVNGKVVKGPISGVGMAFQNSTLMP